MLLGDYYYTDTLKLLPSTLLPDPLSLEASSIYTCNKSILTPILQGILTNRLLNELRFTQTVFRLSLFLCPPLCLVMSILAIYGLSSGEMQLALPAVIIIVVLTVLWSLFLCFYCQFIRTSSVTLDALLTKYLKEQNYSLARHSITMRHRLLCTV